MLLKRISMGLVMLVLSVATLVPNAQVNAQTSSATQTGRVAGFFDSDGDGVDDFTDVCCDTAPGSTVDSVGRPLGDFDNDCDVDLDDYMLFFNNFTGVLDSIGPCVGTCGDGVQQLDEACDDGVDNGSGKGFCNIDCTGIQICGDTYCDAPGETCATCPVDCGCDPNAVITMPPNDILPIDNNIDFLYDGFDAAQGLFYKDVTLQASATDYLGAALTGTSLIWTTDRSDIQPSGVTLLGTGTSLTVRLYSDRCTGVTHTITLTATDGDGNFVTVLRKIFIWTLC
jgi:hypothetical protein